MHKNIFPTYMTGGAEQLNRTKNTSNGWAEFAAPKMQRATLPSVVKKSPPLSPSRADDAAVSSTEIRPITYAKVQQISKPRINSEGTEKPRYPGGEPRGCSCPDRHCCGDADSPASLLSNIPDDRLIKSDSDEALDATGLEAAGLLEQAVGAGAEADFGELLGVLSRLRPERLSKCDRK